MAFRLEEKIELHISDYIKILSLIKSNGGSEIFSERKISSTYFDNTNLFHWFFFYLIKKLYFPQNFLVTLPTRCFFPFFEKKILGLLFYCLKVYWKKSLVSLFLRTFCMNFLYFLWIESSRYQFALQFLNKLGLTFSLPYQFFLKSSGFFVYRNY